MQYDPIKRSLGTVFNNNPLLRKLFYRLLDLLLLRAWHIKKELRLWSKSAPAQVSVLDAGAGFGQYVYFLSRLRGNAQITGVDVKQEQIDDCNGFFAKVGKADTVRFEYADLTKFRRDASYDLIISVDVMEHIEEDIAVFRNFAASLRKGGMLLISTPSDMGGSDVHHDHEDGFVDEHVRDGYSREDIKQKLSAAGFTDISAKYSYGWPGNISWKLSMKYPILLLNTSKLFFILLPAYYIITYPVAFVLNCIDVNISNSAGTGLIVKAFKA